ncbi:hypothetical protein ABT369_02075 [Dactylosporangium sp. NPDC000244]|uniref:hypothetical protein n=1 Tax=Dactylosporangium sp. NPDC000244 TaxID=3154365 RepID=UPI0033182D33
MPEGGVIGQVFGPALPGKAPLLAGSGPGLLWLLFDAPVRLVVTTTAETWTGLEPLS